VAATLTGPQGITFDTFGALFIADTENHRIRKVSPDGTIATVAGNGIKGFGGDGGQAIAARLNRPYAVAVDRTGNLYIADRDNHRVRKVDPSGIITTVVGNGKQASQGEGVRA